MKLDLQFEENGGQFNVNFGETSVIHRNAFALVQNTLPKASEELRGSFVIVPDGNTDKLYVCMMSAGVYRWFSFSDSTGDGDIGGDTEEDTTTISILGQATLGVMILGKGA